MKYDPNNVEALKHVAQAAQPFPEDSVQINANAMHRGSLSWTWPLNEVLFTTSVFILFCSIIQNIYFPIYRLKLILIQLNSVKSSLTTNNIIVSF